MAIDYTTLFTRLGVVAAEINTYLALEATLLGSGTGADKILDQFGGRRDLVTGVQSAYSGFASAAGGWGKTIKKTADAVLSDLQTSLYCPTPSVRDILPLLYVDMVANSKTVKKSTVSVSIDATGSVVGTGSVIASTLNAANLADQRINNETIEIVCVSDRFNGGTFGAEKFSMTGWPSSDAFGIDPRGNGRGPTLSPTMTAANNMLVNGGFDTAFVANVPPSWTLSVGTAGTNCTASTTTLASYSAFALELKSNASAATVTLSQSVTVQPNTLYCITFATRKSTSLNSGSTLTVKYTDASGASKTIAFDPNALTTSYTFKSLFFATGAQPSGAAITITWTTVGGITTGEYVLIDDLTLSEPAIMGDAAYALIRGTAGWVEGDFYIATTANDHAGVFQTFFGRFYDFNLPSATSGAETISDSLAS